MDQYTSRAVVSHRVTILIIMLTLDIVLYSIDYFHSQITSEELPEDTAAKRGNYSLRANIQSYHMVS